MKPRLHLLLFQVSQIQIKNRKRWSHFSPQGGSYAPEPVLEAAVKRSTVALRAGAFITSSSLEIVLFNFTHAAVISSALHLHNNE